MSLQEADDLLDLAHDRRGDRARPLRAFGQDGVDLRWLSPMPEQSLLKAVEGCKRILVVDECRRSGGPSEAIVTLFNEHGIGNVSRIASEDSFIATGPAYAATMPSAESIYQAAIKI